MFKIKWKYYGTKCFLSSFTPKHSQVKRTVKKDNFGQTPCLNGCACLITGHLYEVYYSQPFLNFPELTKTVQHLQKSIFAKRTFFQCFKQNPPPAAEGVHLHIVNLKNNFFVAEGFFYFLYTNSVLVLLILKRYNTWGIRYLEPLHLKNPLISLR